MIRSELIKQLSEANPDLTVLDIDTIVTTFFDEIMCQLAASGRVELRGFGVFSTRARNARTGRNPKSGDFVEVKSKRVPHFKPSSEMQRRLNPSEHVSLRRR